MVLLRWSKRLCGGSLFAVLCLALVAQLSVSPVWCGEGEDEAAALRAEVADLEKRLASERARLKKAEEVEELRKKKAELKQQVEAERAKADAAEVSAKSPAALTNSLGMEFVLIPAGSFEVGCSASEPEGDCFDDEMPRHTVTISRPFYLGKYEVTQAQWEAVMGNNPSEFKGPNRPVENVSWDDIQEFIKKLNAKEGHNLYRLPTEAEWEYAARAGSRTAYSFGNDKGQLGNYAWYDDNSGGETHAVGQKRANAWGLHDMHGNVWEWVQDWYGGYSSGAATDPSGPQAGGFRVLRGGGWYYSARDCRAAFRSRSTPDLRSDVLGFRLARSPGH